VDWLLLGIASGVAFTAVEEGVRRTALMTTTGLGALDRLLDQVSGQTVPSGWVEFRALPVPTGSLTHTSLLPGTVAYAGHAVLTGLVAGAVGLAVATWRAARGSRTFGARAARVGAFLLPPLVLWVAVADHAGMNAQSWAANLTPDVVPKWLDPAISTVPSWLRAPWSALGHGHGRIWLLLLVALACALVDAARLARMPAANLRLQAPPEWVTALGAASRSRRWVRPLRTVAGAGAALVWLTVRDLGQVVLAGARQPGASRLAAARTAMVAGSTLRALREAAFDHLAAPVRTRRQRLLAAGALTALLAVALLLAPAIADHVGRVPWEFPRWLAGLYDAMANWWHDQSFGTQLAIGAAIVALVVFSGGTFGLALGLSGAVTWTLDKGNGIATFIRDPEQATDNYFATATPLQVAADTVGFVATFLPMSFAGGLAGRATRNVIDELRFNAGAFFERRRAVFTTAPDAGAADYSKFRPGEPAHDLADQTHRASALSRRDGSLDSSAQSGQLDDGREARDTLDPMRAPASLAAEKISAGHAFDKHVLARGEFPGITSRAQFAAHIERVVREGEVRVLLRGRVAYWHDGTIVVRNPGAVDGGSAYRPKGGYEYFTETLE
jgi:hypothetical protein